MSPDISSLSFFSKTRDDPFISPSQVPSSQTRMRMKQALRKFSEAALDKWWKEKTKHCLFALITSNYIFSYFPNYLDKRKRNWCLPVISVPVHTPTLKEWQRNYWNVPECTQNVCRMFQNVCIMFQNVPDCSRMYVECFRMFKHVCRMFQTVPKWMQNECRMFQNVYSLLVVTKACMKLHKLTCSYISLHAVTCSK